VDKAKLCEWVFHILKKNPQTHLHTIETEIRQQTDEYDRRDVLTLHEVVWDLLLQGVLAPGKNSLNLNLPFVHVTEYGARCLEEGSILLHDPDGYVAHLLEICGDGVNPLVIESVREGLLDYLAGRPAAAVVMLARAAEDLYDHLCVVLIENARRLGRSIQRLEQSARGSPERYRAILRALTARRLPATLEEQIEPCLTGLSILIQLVRTSDGRPRHPVVERDTALAYLLLFPDQCRIVYDLIARLKEEVGA